MPTSQIMVARGVGQVRGGVKEAHFKRSVELRTYRSK